MENFELTILGCGSAMPTTRHYPSSQILNHRERLFMIDCGEGAHITIQKKQNKIYQITTSFHFAFTWRPLLRIDRTDLHLRYIGTHIRTDYSCTFGCRTRVQTSIGLFLPGLTI